MRGPRGNMLRQTQDLEQEEFFDAQYSGCARHSEMKSSICGRLAAIQSHRSFSARRGGRKRGRCGRARRHRHRRSSAHGFAPSLHQGVEMPWPYVRSKTRGRFCACCGRGFLQTWLDCPNISHCVYRQFKKSLLAILTSQKEVHFSRSGVSDLTTAFSKSSLEAAI